MVVQPTDAGYPSIQYDLNPFNNNNIAGVPEYANVVPVQPGMTVEVPPMAAAFIGTRKYGLRHGQSYGQRNVEC